MNIACVVPTIREEKLKLFQDAWEQQFIEHGVSLVVVKDGKNPTANGLSVKEVMGKYADLIFNFNDGVRNLGFAYVAKFMPDADYILTLDDDTLPLPNSISGHLAALDNKFPLTWMSTATDYVRGIPYGVRDEGECVVSHGVWEGVADWDAPTQLVVGNKPTGFYNGAIPFGVFFPMCGMNVMIKRKALPYFYFAPMGPKVGLDRFADIWCGLNLKKQCDLKRWSIATGYSIVRHERASDVFRNLVKESAGLELNESFWKGDTSKNEEYFELYAKCRTRWEEFIHG